MTKDLEDILVLTYADQVQAKDKPECLIEGCLVSPGRLTDAINAAGKSIWYPGQIAHYSADGTRRQLASLHDVGDIKAQRQLAVHLGKVSVHDIAPFLWFSRPNCSVWAKSAPELF